MHLSKALARCLVTLSLTAGFLTPAQEKPAIQDAPAITLLTEMMSVTGWSALLPALADITVSSTDYSRSQSGVQVILKARPAHNQFRFDIQEGGAFIRNGNLLQQKPAIRSSFLPTKLAKASFPSYLPFFSPLTSFADASVPVHDLGRETFDQQQAEAIDIGGSSAVGLYEPGRFTHMVVYVDTATKYPIGAKIDMPAQSNPSLTIPITWHWGGYQQLGGVLLPTHVEETLYSATIRAATIQSAQINSSLTDADFQ